MKNNLTRKQFYQNEQERGGHLDQPGVHFISIPSDSEQRELPSKPPTEFSTVREYDFGWDYEIELKNYNRLIGNGIHNMNEINQNLINMKQRGDTFEITGFTCTIGTSSIEVTFSGDNKKDDIRLYVGFYAILSDTNGQQMSFKISSASLTEISISGIQTDATFNSSDSSYTVSINKDNLFIPLIAVASGSIAAGDNKLDYTSDNAFVEFGVDISAYHGNHKIVVTNTATGYSADGYLHSVAPGGETLGDELITNGTFDADTDWSKETGVTIEDGVLRLTNVGNNIGASQSGASSQLGKVLYYTVDLADISGAYVRGSLYSTNFPLPVLSTWSTNGTKTGYITCGSSYTVIDIANYSASGSVDIDNFSAKALTDCAATGALIVSTLGGSTRSWTSVDTGFNPNLACDWKIFRVR